jgi:hypothetical protein
VLRVAVPGVVERREIGFEQLGSRVEHPGDVLRRPVVRFGVVVEVAEITG